MEMPDRILVVTTAHWPGDPRLNRHVKYLEAGGSTARIVAFESSSRLRRALDVIRALAVIWRRQGEVVILPDPELFVLGSLLGKVRDVKIAIDIHENYEKAAASRSWVPGWVRPAVGYLARTNDRLARKLADVTLVAAPELADAQTVLVRNIPDPADFKPLPMDLPLRVVYVGDVTEARGAAEIAELAGEMPAVEVLIIGRVNGELRDEMLGVATGGRLRVHGRLPHSEAWDLAGGSVAGLSLLQPAPAYLDAVATKLWEYCASGIPPVVSNLPGQAQFAARISPDLVVDGIPAARQVIERLIDDDEWSAEIRVRSRELAEEDWEANRPDLALQEAMIPRPIT
jgi:hypothetical protein